VSARIVRPGRTVELLEARLSGPDEDLMLARAWRFRTAEVDLSGAVLPEEPPPPAPETVQAMKAFFPTGHDVGYHTATEFRFLAGGFTELGPATAWMRLRYPLVAGEQPAPLERVLAAADSGNGISGVLDFRRHLFVNTDLTVTLSRPPVGEWICLDSTTHADASGSGMTDTALHDRRGRIGRATQALVIAER
jgi:hypothetical protein